MTDYNNQTTINCEECADRTLCMFYRHGVRSMLRCPSYVAESDAPRVCSAIANEDTAMLNQAEEGGDE